VPYFLEASHLNQDVDPEVDAAGKDARATREPGQPHLNNLAVFEPPLLA
jgi:hypothetical protein